MGVVVKRSGYELSQSKKFTASLNHINNQRPIWREMLNRIGFSRVASRVSRDKTHARAMENPKARITIKMIIFRFLWASPTHRWVKSVYFVVEAKKLRGFAWLINETRKKHDNQQSWAGLGGWLRGSAFRQIEASSQLCSKQSTDIISDSYQYISLSIFLHKFKYIRFNLPLRHVISRPSYQSPEPRLKIIMIFLFLLSAFPQCQLTYSFWSRFGGARER